MYSLAKLEVSRKFYFCTKKLISFCILSCRIQNSPSLGVYFNSGILWEGSNAGFGLGDSKYVGTTLFWCFSRGWMLLWRRLGLATFRIFFLGWEKIVGSRGNSETGLGFSGSRSPGVA